VERLAEALAAVAGIAEVRAEERGATFSVPADDEAQAGILRALLAAGLPVSAFAPERRSMQDAYLATVAAKEAP
jgi:ABC-type uncharacterized transport system ATPase subunit